MIILSLLICANLLIGYSLSMGLIIGPMPEKAKKHWVTALFYMLSVIALMSAYWGTLLPDKCSIINMVVFYTAMLILAPLSIYMRVWKRTYRFVKRYWCRQIPPASIQAMLQAAKIAAIAFIEVSIVALLFLAVEHASIKAKIADEQQQQAAPVASHYQIGDGDAVEEVSTNHVKKVVDKHSDLAVDRKITADQMNALIGHWCRYKTDSKMVGTGAAFIKASENTGLDPVFLMAIAGHESAWGSSKLHTDKNNPYSICMYDYNVHAGLNMGSTFGEGIITGAEWIDKNYYSEGQTSLYSMIYGKKCYAQAKDSWINSIQQIMNRSYDLLDNM